jgi:isoquinoline 1-oxidoreductase subunit alpha
MLKLTVNGKPVEVEADPEMPLLWVLRDVIGLRGTKFGCGKGLCGACTVHVNGQAIRSCSMPVSAVSGEVETIEGLAADPHHPVHRAWLETDVPQCGYCQPGQMMACASLIQQGLNAEQVQAGMTNLCRCGTYGRIRKAAARAVELARSGGGK